MIIYPNTDYDSWISEDLADVYFENRLNADSWFAAANKETALITAFRSLAGLNLNITLDDDGIISSDVYTTSEAEAILQNLKNAQCEQALHELIHEPDNPKITGLSLGGLLSVKIPNDQKSVQRHSQRALSILRPYIIAQSVKRTR